MKLHFEILDDRNRADQQINGNGLKMCGSVLVYLMEI